MLHVEDKPINLLTYEREDGTQTTEAELRTWDGIPRVYITARTARLEPEPTESTIALRPDECRYLIRALQAAVFEMDAIEGKLPETKAPNP